MQNSQNTILPDHQDRLADQFKHITYLINKSILDGKVPALWKIAKIIPLHEKGDKSNPDN